MIELMLAMVFIAMLLIMITLLIMQISRTYNKGLTLRSANEAGQLISSDMQRKLNSSTSSTVRMIEDGQAEDEENNVVAVEKTGGRLCAAGTVYAWKYPGARDGGINGNGTVRLVKFNGAMNAYCPQNATPQALPTTDQMTDLLTSEGNTLAIRNFSYESTNRDLGGQTIHRVSFTLGTDATDLITANGNCRPPAAVGVGAEFCAVNTFTFTARSGGGAQ